MSEDPILIKGYADLISDRKLSGDDPDTVARELQANGGDDDYLVAWLPDWLVDEKDVELLGRSDNLVSGRVDHETEKAYLLLADGDEVWLPKSVIRVYRVSGGGDLEIPQHGLTDFTNGGSR
ncbi:hypothetical protein [Haloferax sp. Atlit-4N]|uniref:hypothetical protein n=1 Tax=Haloferax sp. Atlit-4N TaxID=2077206 RepID=UPI0011C01F6F|nr:hypothetical protein [Haloferax sp. Atlit-4N]